MSLYYEKYDLLSDPSCNPTFDEILHMSQGDFVEWIRHFRKEVVKAWDERGQPPRVGYNRDEIVDNFRSMTKDFSLKWMETVDLRTGKPDVIRNTTTAGNAVNQWFPTMMKTRITYGKNVAESRSIYDFFAKDELFDTFCTYANRHFKRDSFYHYSNPISEGDLLPGTSERVKDFDHFLTLKLSDDYDWFLCPVKEDKQYTGFNTALKAKKNLVIDQRLINTALLRMKHTTNVDVAKWNVYSVRLYKKGQRLFPVGLKAFRVSFCQYAVNFPPLTARHLYERYSEPFERTGLPTIIYDPSSGWGGRLLGAMSVNTDRRVLYLGTDPNTDHLVGSGWSKYQDFATFFNHNVREKQGSIFESANYGHAFRIFRDGSEEIGRNVEFQKFKGHVDIVFTSPPYFAKEVYSEDAEQSCHKFGAYDTWRDGFLKPTLETAVEWLKPGGYLLWNVSDIVMAGVEHPLVQDSIDIVTSLGLTHTETLKLALAQMPGGNRLEETGDFEEVEEHTLYETTTKKIPVMKGKMKYFCEVRKESGKGKMFLKYEPILVFHKPL